MIKVTALYFLLSMQVPALSKIVPMVKGYHLNETVQEVLDQNTYLGSAQSSCATIPNEKAARKHNIDWATCQLLRAAESGARVNLSDTSQSLLDIRFVFENSKLVKIRFEYRYPQSHFISEYARLHSALVEKLGEPTTEGTDEFQNSYGAQYSYPNAYWVGTDYIAAVQCKAAYNRYAGEDVVTVFLTISTAEEEKKLQTLEQRKPNPLE